ncbi:MAG: hypothetical protein BWY76_00851 [bacterium ADurb.Bin429]|nr:MAG: hypothetical protein BWY76_00851 [bacterium ADurb.Bin429]
MKIATVKKQGVQAMRVFKEVAPGRLVTSSDWLGKPSGGLAFSLSPLCAIENCLRDSVIRARVPMTDQG